MGRGRIKVDLFAWGHQEGVEGGQAQCGAGIRPDTRVIAGNLLTLHKRPVALPLHSEAPRLRGLDHL